MESTYFSEIAAICVPVLIAIAGYVAKIVESFFNKKKEMIDKEIELKDKQDRDERFLKYLSVVTQNAQDIVTTINADIVEGLKAASSDGKLTEDEIKGITDQAVNMLSNMMSDDAKELMSEFIGDLNDYFTVLVKSTVEKVKNKK